MSLNIHSFIVLFVVVFFFLGVCGGGGGLLFFGWKFVLIYSCVALVDKIKQPLIIFSVSQINTCCIVTKENFVP